jgi:FAD/FMN-containing dehydrogenase
MDLSRREFVVAVAAATLTSRDAQARLTPGQLRGLRAAVRGPVYTPGRAGYDRARVVFNRRFDAIRPPAVVRVRDSADVAAVVRWAERHDVALVARSGGHAYNGASTSRTAVVVDVGGLDRIAAHGDSVTAGPGARLIDVYTALARRGHAIPAGSCPSVALGGLALGGGMGLAGRALGLTLDRVTSIDVVTADGRRRTVDATRDDDLFWALRGGGGSFGIVTALRLRTHAVRQAAWFSVSFPRRSREEALAAWDRLAPTAPRALTAILTLTRSDASAFGQHLGSEQALRGLIGGLARVPGAQVRTGTSPYLALQRRWAGCADGGCHTVHRDRFDASSVYVAKRLSAAGRRAFVHAADSGVTLICDAYGGAINAVAADATAFVHRDVRFSVQILDYAAPSGVAHARRLIAPYGNGGAYANYPDLRLNGALRAYYGANYAHLVQVKRTHDPGNRFTVAQGIRA